MHRTRRATRLASMLGAMVLLAACGSGSGESDQPASGDTSPSESGAVASFPVTVEGAYGPITVEKEPERVVVLDASYLDMLGSLGVEPVAFYGYLRTQPDFISAYPWFEGRDLSGHDPALIGADWSPSAERIATHEPDLILGESWQIDESMLAQLSAIAPTFVADGVDWREDLPAVAALLGMSDAGDQALATFDAEMVAAKERLAAFAGKSYIAGWYRDNDLQVFPNQYLEDVGFVPLKCIADSSVDQEVSWRVDSASLDGNAIAAGPQVNDTDAGTELWSPVGADMLWSERSASMAAPMSASYPSRTAGPNRSTDHSRMSWMSSCASGASWRISVISPSRQRAQWRCGHAREGSRACHPLEPRCCCLHPDRRSPCRWPLGALPLGPTGIRRARRASPEAPASARPAPRVAVPSQTQELRRPWASCIQGTRSR